MQSRTDLLIEGLQEAYDVERQLLAVLPKMRKAAFSQELQDALSVRSEQTRSQLKRVEELLKKLHAKSGSRISYGITGMIAEAERTVSEAREAHPAVLDAALIAVAQRAEHYKIAVYRALCTYTQILVGSEAAEMLQLTLNEEVEADLKLTRLAETAVNLDAAEAGQEVQKNAEDGGAEQPWGSPMK